MKNLYAQEIENLKVENCQEPEAAALQMCIEKAVREKSYKVFDYGLENPEQEYKNDVIVVFSKGKYDVLFGFFILEDGEPAIQFSSPDGLQFFYL